MCNNIVLRYGHTFVAHELKKWAGGGGGVTGPHILPVLNALGEGKLPMIAGISPLVIPPSAGDDGEWTRWLRCNFQATIRTAQRYIRLARHLPALERDATRVSPESQSEASRAILQSLLRPIGGTAGQSLASQDPKRVVRPSGRGSVFWRCNGASARGASGGEPHSGPLFLGPHPWYDGRST
jgi:hypothetical protein